jgi:K(+)-stimulated pyrophosphate-energized sodium pump
LLLSVEALGGFLAGLLLTAHLMALLQASAGGALQQARRYIEDGHVGGKNSAAHQHAIVGDAVGQPLQESAGPAMSVLLHLAAITTLLIAPVIVVLRLPGEPPGIAAIIVSILCLVGLVWAVWQASNNATLSTTPPKKATR